MVIIMKKILVVFFTGLMILMVSGCGKNDEIQNRKAQNLSSEEIINLDLSENGTDRMLSINDICVHTEPLVYKENIFNESGELVQFIQYEYDECNRYKTIYNYQKNPQNSEMVLFLQEDYSYDEYFYYKLTTYVQNGGLVTQDIYDTHNNIVMAQMPNRKYDGVSTVTYTYKYPIDTEKVAEEYAYVGESIYFSHYTVSHFNEYGDETYVMTRYDDSIDTETYDYNYDSDGRMLSKYETRIEEDIYGEEKSTFKTVYTYDEKGLLISEEENYVLNEDNLFMEICSSETRHFEYDDMGRLIKKETRHKTESGYSESDESYYFVEYVYETESSEFENAIPEVQGGDDA